MTTVNPQLKLRVGMRQMRLTFYQIHPVLYHHESRVRSKDCAVFPGIDAEDQYGDERSLGTVTIFSRKGP